VVKACVSFIKSPEKISANFGRYDELLPTRLLDRANGKIHPMFY
jgi:hypothetical protein